jgi:hypothetical protein
MPAESRPSSQESRGFRDTESARETDGPIALTGYTIHSSIRALDDRRQGLCQKAQAVPVTIYPHFYTL